MEKKLQWVDSLKGLAIVGVVFVHSGGALILGSVGAASARGVQLLYIISGFLAFLSISNLKDVSNRAITKWWIRKFFRLAPLYFLFIIIYVILTIVLPETALIDLNDFTVWGGIIITFFLNAFSPHYAGVAIMMSYVPNLVLFLILTPFLYKRINNIYDAIIVTIISYFSTSIIICIFKLILIGHGLNSEDWVLYLDNRSFLVQFPIYCIGIVLFFFYRNYTLQQKIVEEKEVKLCSEPSSGHCFGKEISLFGNGHCLAVWVRRGGGYWRAVFWASLYWLISLILWPAGSVGRKPFWINMYVLYSMGFLGIIVSQFYCPYKLIINKYWAILGKHSYGIFLSHMVFLRFIEIKDFCMRENIYLTVILKFMFVLLISLILSIVIELFVDKVFDRICKMVIIEVDRYFDG